MKKTLFLLALCAFGASCNQTGKVAELQRENDSLKAVINKTYGVSTKWATKTSKTVYTGTLPSTNPNDFSDYFLLDTTANTYVKRWDTLIRSNPQQLRQLIVDTSNRAFIIPANNMREVMDNMHCNYFVFMLGINDANRITLVYTGARGTADSLQLITIAPIKDSTNNQNDTRQYVLDNTLPCPVCPAAQTLAPAPYKLPDSSSTK